MAPNSPTLTSYSDTSDGFVTYVDLDTNCYYSYADEAKEYVPTFWDAVILPVIDWALCAIEVFRPRLPREASFGRLALWSSKLGCMLPGLRVPGS